MNPETQWSNLRRSIQVAIGNTVSYGGSVYPVLHDYYSADPDDLANASNRKPAWVETAFIKSLAGRRSDAILQLDIFSQTGDHDGDGGDQFGFRVDGIADVLASLFVGVGGAGLQKGYITVVDYTSDINNPTNTNMVLLMQSSVGNVGELEDRRRLDFSQDFRRVTMRMRFRTIQDAAGRAAFYTN